MARPLTKTGSDFTRSFLSGFLLTSEIQPIDCFLLINGATWDQIATSNERYFTELRQLREELEKALQGITSGPASAGPEERVSLNQLNQLIASGEDVLYWSRTMRRYLTVSEIVDITPNNISVQVSNVIRSVFLPSICSTTELQDERNEGSPWLKQGIYPQECLLIVPPAFQQILYPSRYQEEEILTTYAGQEQALLDRHLNMIKELLTRDIINQEPPLYWSRTRSEYMRVSRISNVYYDRNPNVEEHDIKLDLQIGNTIRTVKYQNMCPIY